MTDEPFALFLTWTTYGSWPPGDARGHVSNTLRNAGPHRRSGYRPRENRLRRPFRGGDAVTRRRAQALQTHDTTLLTPAQARVAAESFLETCGARDWTLLRGAVMTNHVHLVVSNCPDDASGVRRLLKGRSQAALSKAFGLRKWWTTGGSDRYLHTDAAILGAIRYTAEQHGAFTEIGDGVLLPPPGDLPPDRPR